MKYTKHFIILLVAVMMHGLVEAQEKITISGVIKDKDSLPLKGVSVQTKTPAKVVGLTSQNGQFSVSVNKNTELLFSYTGYEVYKLKAVSDVALDIILVQKENKMDEVIVQGFKKVVRDQSTGSTTIVSGKDIQDVPVSNAMELLQGKVPGLNIQNNNGSPGGMGTINLRGVSNINVSDDGLLTPTSPLFIIDGVPVDVNSNFEYGFQGSGTGISPLALIPSEDIESLEVLKDAVATAQYGSRATYGVIIVTTKRGKSKVPILQFSSNLFIKTVPPLRNVLGGKEEREVRINTILNFDTSIKSARALINATPFLSDKYNNFYNNSTDWQDYFFNPTSNHTHNLSIQGGDVRFNYKTNLNYYQENGVVANTGFKRYSLSMNSQYAPTDQFKMVVNISGSLGQKQNGSGVGLLQTGIAKSASTSSLLPPPSLFSANNSALAAASINNDNKTANINMSLDIQYEIFKGIRLTNLVSYNYNSGTSDRFTPAFLSGGTSESYTSNDNTRTLYNRSTLGFNKTLSDKHNINGYVFNEINAYGYRANPILLNSTANDQIAGPAGVDVLRSKGGTLSNLKETRQHGYGGSLTYSFAKKYIIDLSMRWDGLSTNGPATGYSENPAVGLRWNFQKEKFFESMRWLSYGSVRSSWGRNIRPVGNVFDVYGKYIIGGQYNNNPTVSIELTSVPNTSLLPETQNSFSTAVEMGFWESRIQATFETYYRSLDNQPFKSGENAIGVPNYAGFNKTSNETVSVVNYGVEWTFSYVIFPKKSAFEWTVSTTGALNRAVLTKLPYGYRQFEVQVKDLHDQYVPVSYRLGRSPFSNLIYITQGIYGSMADVPVNLDNGLRLRMAGGPFDNFFTAGDPRWVDINGDYIISDADLAPVGDPIPKVTGGITSRMAYKDFQLNINTSITFLRDILNTTTATLLNNYTDPAGQRPNTLPGSLFPLDQINYWKPTDPKDKTIGTVGAKYPNPFDFRRAVWLNPFRTNQTLFLEDGSYFKINNVILLYNVNKKYINKYHMSSCRLSFSVNNVFTFSNYSGPDPETVTALGRDDSGGYPNARSFSFGVNIQF